MQISIMDRNTGKTTEYDSAEQAADAMELEVDDLLWAIEEYGRCDAFMLTAWETGTPGPQGRWE